MDARKSYLYIGDSLHSPSRNRQESGDTGNTIHRILEGDRMMRFDEDINRILHVEATGSPDVRGWPMPCGDLPYLRVRLGYGEPSCEVGDLRPIARLNPPNLALLFQYGMDDFGRIDHEAKRIEVVDQRFNVVHSEADSLDARRPRIDVLVTNHDIVGKNVSLVIGRHAF